MPVHGTAVALDGEAVLLLGGSGSGKSDLAFRMLDRGWRLVGDDQLHLSTTKDGVCITGDPRLRDRLEVRGLGIMPVETLKAPVRLRMVVHLEGTPARLPEAASHTILGVKLPAMVLNAFEFSAPIKLEWAFRDPALIGRTSLANSD